MQKFSVTLAALSLSAFSFLALSSCCSPCQARAEARKAAKLAEEAAAEGGHQPAAGEIGGPPVPEAE